MIEYELILAKIGSSVLQQSGGLLDLGVLSSIVRDIVSTETDNYKILIVSSGAIAAGKEFSVTTTGVPKLMKAPYYASIGQPLLFNYYSKILSIHGKNSAQILISRDSFANRVEYFSIRDTLRNLLNNNVIPIINNNDILHEQSIGYSDNDLLSAYLGGMLSVRKVIFLTSVSGVYRNYPSQSDGDLIDIIDTDLISIEELCATQLGLGSMQSKIKAARLLSELGIECMIGNGREPKPISSLLKGSTKCTRIISKSKRTLTGVRKWLCTGAIPKGTLIVSKLGAKVISDREKRGSLLSKGIVEIKGDFSKNDVVSVCDEDLRLLGYGISKYSSREIIGLNEQEGIIIIHADYFYGIDHSYFD
jgi:glutamate 5-kinase